MIISFFALKLKHKQLFNNIMEVVIKKFRLIHVIICDLKNIVNIFPVTAIVRRLKKKMEPIIFINSKDHIFKNSNFLITKIRENLKTYLGDYEGKDWNFADISMSNLCLYLINIGPRPDLDIDSLIFFIEKYEENIKLWLYNHNDHNWVRAIKYINQYQQIIDYYDDNSILNVLEKHKIHSPLKWKRAEDSMIHTNLLLSLPVSKLALRYLRADYVAKVIDDNNGSDNRLLLFFAAIDELDFREIDKKIENFLDLFPFVVKETEKAKKRLSDKSKLFRKANRAGRAVAYANLGNVTLVNIPEVLAYGTQSCPWLCAVEYKINNHKFIKFNSRKLDVAPIVSDYISAKVEGKALMKLLSIEIAKY